MRAIADIEDEFGEVIYLDAPGPEGAPVRMVFRRPTVAEWEKLGEFTRRDETTESQLQRRYATTCCVEPADAMMVKRMFDAHPVMVTPIVVGLNRLAGASVSFDVEDDADHGRAVAAELDGTSVKLKAPDHASWSIYVDSEKSYSAAKKLILSCCVAPSAEQLGTLLDKFPAAAARLGDGIADIGGASIEINFSKN